MADGTISSFRQKRGRLLAQKIEQLAKEKQRPITIIDVGGRRDYWDNVGFAGIGRIVLVNIDPADLGRMTSREDIFVDKIGDAASLGGRPSSACIPRRSNNARSRAACGFEVVSRRSP